MREIEQRIQNAESQPVDIELPERPTDIPSSFDAHTKLMFDLQALAFQADITRVFSMIMSRELSTMTFPSIGVPEQHHGVSHHRNDPQLIAKKARIDLYQSQLFAYFPRSAASRGNRRRAATGTDRCAPSSQSAADRCDGARRA